MNNFLEYTNDEMKEEIVKLGEKPYRANQISSWLMKGKTFEEMTNLSKELQSKLRACYREGFAEIIDRKTSKDSTVKYLYELADGNTIESVLMRRDYGNTVCISTQVGCRMGCSFCASCKQGRIRNLSAGEMLAQVIQARSNGIDVNHVVLMGMGEPFDNYEQTIRFLRRANDPNGLNIGARNISVSTCGLPNEITKFAHEGIPVTLSISLHAAFDEKRKKIMPIASRYTIKEILSAANFYFKKTGRRIIIEYIVIKGFNDTHKDASELAKVLDGMECHVNLIPLNTEEKGSASLSGPHDADTFSSMLQKNGLSATVRRSMGKDILGACGQLRSRHLGNQELSDVKQAH